MCGFKAVCNKSNHLEFEILFFKGTTKKKRCFTSWFRDVYDHTGRVCFVQFSCK